MKETIRSIINFWNLPFGNIATASFIIAVVSGIFLAIPYDVKNPYESVSALLLLNPAGVFFRNIHYWSAQIFLVFTILHIIDHLKRKTENRVKEGVWLRLTVSVFFIFFIMLSGFILKGDADSQQAFSIFSSLLKEIPFIGDRFAFTLLGKEGDYQILYVNHIATATIILSVIIIEHSKIIWQKNSVFLYSLISSALLGYIFTPMLHDGINSVIKGPWYFVGLQEILHWISQTQLVLLFTFLLFVAFYLIKRESDNLSLLTKKIFIGLGIIYLFLTIIGYYFRGENWEFVLPWNNTYKFISDFLPLSSFSDVNSDDLPSDKIKTVLGRKEGCIVCHQMDGFESSHNPEVIGCYSCHRGNAFTLNKASAHSGIILIPGNLSNAHLTCGTAQCHPDIIPRVNNSIMNTLSGIISVNKYVFNEIKKPDGYFNVKDLLHTNAESHLRNLCASCHVGNEKTEWGAITELSRGGGCNACHLNYNNEAIEQLSKYQNSTEKNENLPKVHPQINLKISNDHCFGCHSRSGRISTNYKGLSETLTEAGYVEGNDQYTLLADGRVFRKTYDDVHHKAGMECIDCHIAQEVMGDGNLYKHKEEQVKIKCEDCHSGNKNSISYQNLDYESRKIVDLRKFKRTDVNFLSTLDSNYVYTNAFIDNKGNKYLITKTINDSLPIKLPALICTEGKAHQRLSCNSCHTQWVSNCVGCHTEYNPNEEGFDLLDKQFIKGSWIETSFDFYVDYPTLGIRKDKSGKEIVDTFIPGMIITIEKLKSKNEQKIFKRLFAPTVSHTTNKTGRSCESCHNNPQAIGYGRGELIYDKKGKWSFIPKMILRKEDGLPQDAWIPFFKRYDEVNSTRINTRPFNLEEQKNILTVGACLKCHKSNSKVMQNSLIDFDKTMRNVSSNCILPVWN